MKKKLVVYDFDKTIYDGETGVNFSVFYLKKYPLKSILFLITYSRYLFLYLFKIVNLTKIKEKYFKFLEFHTKKEIQDLIDEFWETKKNKIYPWVKEELQKNRKEADFVIVTSASPLFLIEKFLLSQGYDIVFGTRFVGDNQKKFVAQINGKNNKGDEKVKKLNRWAKQNNYEIEIVRFYSDSLADKPLYDVAKRKFWIKRGKILEGMPKRKTLIDKLFWN